VRVSVSRSGGVAGLTRRWSVAAPPQEPAAWTALVESCPWDAAAAADEVTPGSPRGADRFTDRFTWTIEVDLAGRSHRAVVPETQVQGPWRALIDAVRASDSARG